MSSAWRNGTPFAAIVVGALLLHGGLSAVALEKAEAAGSIGERERRRKVDPNEPRAEYDGRFAFTRIRVGPVVEMNGGRFRREPPWMHDFPRADFHFLKILGELTFVNGMMDQGNIRTLDDPDLPMFPVAYMSEPGFWVMSDEEQAGLRNYLLKGGFIIFDDFRGPHIQNLEAQMRRVYPEAAFQKLDTTHPIFHSFFEIKALDPRSGYYADMGDTEWLGIFEDNDPQKRLIAIANNNHDLGELWEFSDTGYVPVDLSNEAYKFGVNYVIYAMTH